MSKKFPGTFITLEGPEGAGKTTQVKHLTALLSERGIDHLVTRDPGGTPLGKKIRRILLTPGLEVSPRAELLLYQADRAQHVEELILPALKAGKLVICDRYTDSTMAYQGFGRGIDFDLIENLNQIATGGLKPEYTFLFDLDSEEGLSRRHPAGYDRMEREAMDFHHRVRNGYLTLAKKEPERWYILDAAKPLSAVQQEFQEVFFKKYS
jgi:dTMP kinase